VEGVKEPQETLFVVMEIPIFALVEIISWLAKHLPHKEDINFVLPHLWAIPLFSICTDKCKVFDVASFALNKVCRQMKPVDLEVLSPQQRSGMLVLPISAKGSDSFSETIAKAKSSLEDLGFDCQPMEPSICIALHDKPFECPSEPVVSFLGNQLWLASPAMEPPFGFQRIRQFLLSGT